MNTCSNIKEIFLDLKGGKSLPQILKTGVHNNTQQKKSH